jgi:uncharacterized membrane protein YcaP (DUF421 family)|tara:strand:+ start:376 stop:693 length:318 start_codon:yes stop_codon:yes gene_type:complete
MEKLAEVHWLDIVASAGWESIKDVNPAVMETTGYIVYRDKEVIKIANTKDDKGAWFGIHAIPMGCVKKIRPLSGAVKVKRSSKKQVKNETGNQNIYSIPGNDSNK